MATVQFDNVSKRFGNDVLAVDGLTLDVGEGEFLILVGPSGCGKTTALRMVAGLEDVTSGEIRIADRLVNDLPPTDRDVAMVFQNYALYPHMSVADNIAFPLRQRKLGKAEIRERVDEVARLLGIEELLERRPRALSGGQRQRVAIGRALVRRPQTFLMDEPLSNLDAKLRVQMRAELIALHKRIGITTIYVTHDQTEAMTLGDRVVVLNKGVVQQVDAPERLYRAPVNTFVAGFIGSPAMNFLEGQFRNGELRVGAYAIPVPETLRAHGACSDGAIVVGLRPEDFSLNGDGEASLPARVAISERLGPEVLAHVHVDGVQIADLGEQAARTDAEDARELRNTIVARFDPSFAGEAGARLELKVKPERLQLFDPESGRSLSAAPQDR
jgi:multiple sugar transport system ATP-binding protein